MKQIKKIKKPHLNLLKKKRKTRIHPDSDINNSQSPNLITSQILHSDLLEADSKIIVDFVFVFVLIIQISFLIVGLLNYYLNQKIVQVTQEIQVIEQKLERELEVHDATRLLNKKIKILNVSVENSTDYENYAYIIVPVFNDKIKFQKATFKPKEVNINFEVSNLLEVTGVILEYLKSDLVDNVVIKKVVFDVGSEFYQVEILVNMKE